MSNSGPRVGITTNNPSKAGSYAKAVEAAGGAPVWITPDDIRSAGERTALQKIDALLLSGGRDIDPRFYAETVMPGLDVDVDTNRYEVEIPLGRAALDDQLPVLGICGGMQVLNVASGGSLYQDISLLGVNPAVHRVKGKDIFHEVRIVPGSRLAEILGRSELLVNSAHHQAIKQPGKGAIVTATAPDGVIEAIEFPAPFAIGVEWHPERMPDDEHQHRLFQALVSAASGARSRA